MGVLRKQIPLEMFEEPRDLISSEVEALTLDVAVLALVVLEPNLGG
jgi:hypothetical protein